MSKAATAKIKPQSELPADIDRLAAVNAERKALEKEEELLEWMTKPNRRPKK